MLTVDASVSAAAAAAAAAALAAWQAAGQALTEQQLRFGLTGPLCVKRRRCGDYIPPAASLAPGMLVLNA